MSRGDPCLAHGCSWCCHDTEMPLTEDDIARLEARGHARAAFVAYDNDGTARLATVASSTQGGPRPCHFLREGRCSVYDDRPEGCRVYPLVLTEDHELTRDEECPHHDGFAVDPAARTRILRVLSRVEAEAIRRRAG